MLSAAQEGHYASIKLSTLCHTVAVTGIATDENLKGGGDMLESRTSTCQSHLAELY